MAATNYEAMTALTMAQQQAMGALPQQLGQGLGVSGAMAPGQIWSQDAITATEALLRNSGFEHNQYGQSFKVDVKDCGDIINFYRVNEPTSIYIGAEVAEPLDELRIEVAKWLN